MVEMGLIKISFIVATGVLVFLERKWLSKQGRDFSLSKTALLLIALINTGFVVFLFFNHVNFPLNLEITEGTILQSFQKAVEFKAIYPAPTPEYVPFAYNPLYYFFAVPFSSLFGVGFFTLRFLSIVGTVLNGMILYVVIRRKSGSSWWGLLGLGLFAAAYHVMDNYFDAAHPDSWLLFCLLLGTYLIDINQSRALNLLAVIVLAISFWFKQHGALFLFSGMAFLTWREGLKKSSIYWLVGLLLGPIIYLFLGPILFGSHFHYFTWEVPRQWSEMKMKSLRYFVTFIVKGYPILLLSSVIVLFDSLMRTKKRIDIWLVMLVCSALAGLIGAMDPGSSNNNYIPLGTLLIIVGTLRLRAMEIRQETYRFRGLWAFALFFSFGALMYNPFSVIVPRDTKRVYEDMIHTLRDLEGIVYAPAIGQLQDGYRLHPAVHWAALEDMIRGPGRDTRNHPNTRLLLDPIIHPKGPAFILSNVRLNAYPWMAFLGNYYTLESDFGDRFKSLRILPVRFDHKWPRYLYRYAPTLIPQNLNNLGDGSQ